MDKEYVKGLIQKILDKEFASPARRKVRDYVDRLNFCAPCCGDSHNNEHKKRGNLYLKSLRFVCFNCGASMGLDRLCKKHNEVIDPDKKLEMIEYLDSVITYKDAEASMADARFENLIELSELERIFSADITPISDFKPIQSNSGVYKYLIGRGIGPEFHKNIYQAKYWKNEDEHEWIIVMLNRRDDKVLGMQIRNLKEGKRRMFKIYNYENLLEWIMIGKDTEPDVDVSEIVIYNKLSYYFNILNVNFSDTVTVFEGYIDSLYLPNSIGLVGVNTDFRLLEGSGLDLRYFFDNDEAGYRKTEEKMREGYPVFLWKKLFEDIVLKKKSSNPEQLMHRISKVKDMNKLAQLVPEPYKKLILDNFFSKDEFDIRWLPKYGRRKKEDDKKDYNSKFRFFDNM
jgi:hypothetical protein